MKTNLWRQNLKKQVILTYSLFACLSVINAQNQSKLSVTGQIQDEKSHEPIPFANIVILGMPDSALITGTASNITGGFEIASLAKGGYYISVSAIGYEKVTKPVEVTDNFDAGTILLKEISVNINEVVVAGERLKARKETGKTTYYINKKMTEISNTGMDILGYIPGIQVDISKNISVDGAQNIIILVDGKERDKNYVSQLNPGKIDKVEVISSPGSRYDASVSGVINIILKENTDLGFGGHLYAEIPTSASVIYAFPGYSFNYGFKKLNVFTSYNGQISYFDIIESGRRVPASEYQAPEIISEQNVRQKDWSHRFHYGFDYQINKNNQFGFYGFYNPFSREFDGTLDYVLKCRDIEDTTMTIFKNDSGKNHSAFYSLFFRHNFKKPGSKITFDFSYNRLFSETGTSFTGSESNESLSNQTNSVKPNQNSLNARMDLITPVSEKIKVETGLKTRLQNLTDRQLPDFQYDDNILAGYGIVGFNSQPFVVKTGARAEYSVSGLTGNNKNAGFILLPQATVSYKINPEQNIELSYTTSVYRPSIYELNPNTTFTDPFSVYAGNPDLQQELRKNLKFEYSRNFGDSYFSTGFFLKTRENAVNQSTFINDSGLYQTSPYNLGNIYEYGFHVSGSVKIFKRMVVNPFLKVFNIQTEVNNSAFQNELSNRKEIAIESGLSAIATFKHKIALSFQFQYNSPRIDIQNRTFSDPLWFVSFEKGFGENLKVGVSGALFFTGQLTYTGNEIQSEHLYSYSEGNLQLPALPVWFKVRYQFNKGKKSGQRNRENEDIIEVPKKGF
jgi:hypothetical protein